MIPFYNGAYPESIQEGCNHAIVHKVGCQFPKNSPSDAEEITMTNPNSDIFSSQKEEARPQEYKPPCLPQPKAARFNTGKPMLSLVLEAPNALNLAAEVLEFGSKKYSRGNYKKGLPYTGVIDSLLRHVVKFLSGEDLDEETGKSHAGHILCNALILAEMTAIRPDMDDRSKYDE